MECDLLSVRILCEIVIFKYLFRKLSTRTSISKKNIPSYCKENGFGQNVRPFSKMLFIGNNNNNNNNEFL